MAASDEVFQSFGLGADALGLGAGAPQALAFGLEPEAVEPGLRVALPGSPQAASEALDARAQWLDDMGIGLQALPERLGQLARHTQEPAPQVNFALGEASPEAELLAALRQIDQPEALSFGFDESLNAAAQKARASLDALAGAFDRSLLHFVWVETSVAGQVLARSTLSWSGDAQTVWLTGVSPAQMSLHQRSLQIATQTRSLRLQMIITALGGAARLAVFMSNPASSILALPALVQYIQQAIRQFADVRAETRLNSSN